MDNDVLNEEVALSPKAKKALDALVDLWRQSKDLASFRHWK